MKKEFRHIGELVKKNRIKVGLSQQDLSRGIGYNNGQFISNIERHLCGVPDHKIEILSRLLKIDYTEIIEAILNDRKDTIISFMIHGKKEQINEN